MAEYKTGEIKDSDIINNNSLFIRIFVHNSPNFTGNKDNILVEYSRQPLKQQDTIYLDYHGKQKITSEHDLSKREITEIVQIGFYKNSNEEIQAVKMPKTIEKVPTQLPSEITSLAGGFCWYKFI